MTNSSTPRNFGGGSIGRGEKSITELQKPPTFRLKRRYKFDNTLAKGAKAMIGWLVLASVIASIPITIILASLPSTIHDQVLQNETAAKGAFAKFA